MEAPAPAVVRRFANYSKAAAVLAIFLAYHVLEGWVFDIPLLGSPGAAFAPTTASQAASAFLAGVALYLLPAQPAESRRSRLIGRACVLGSIALALAALLERWFPLNLDALFAHGGGLPPPALSEVGPTSQLCLGGALLLLQGRRHLRIADALCLLPGALSLLSLAGYLYGARPFAGQMSLYAAILVFLIASGALCARADQGFMAKVSSNSFGGLMARRLLPATLVIPVTLGWLQRQGLRARLYPAEPGLAIFTVVTVAAFVGVIWWSVNSLYRMDTKRRKMERDLDATAAQLKRSNADLEQFAYVASHDLKEPLRAISGSVQVLQGRFKEKVGAQADDIVKITVDGVKRMQTLIDDLLTYSRLTTREAPFEIVDSAQILQGVLANLDAAIKESRAVVTADPLPVIRGDATQLLQVFQNLISNAIKYRSERTPKIHVSAEERGAEWQFSVRDNGIGIAPQYQERIFRIFQRLHTRDYPGTGIGLAVCKKIIERHGGRIWVESEPEEGATFYFTVAKKGGVPGAQ